MAIKFSTKKASKDIQRCLYNSLAEHCSYVGCLPEGKRADRRERSVEVYQDDSDCVTAWVVDKRYPLEARLVSGAIVGPQERDVVKMLGLEKYVVDR